MPFPFKKNLVKAKDKNAENESGNKPKPNLKSKKPLCKL